MERSTYKLLLEMADDSTLQIADALLKYYLTRNVKNTEIALIELEELAEHIFAYIKAERKKLDISSLYDLCDGVYNIEKEKK